MPGASCISIELVALSTASLIAASDLDGTESSKGDLPAPGAMTLEEMERAMITRSMEHYGGNITRVAEALGLSRPALYRRLEKYGLDPEAE